MKVKISIVVPVLNDERVGRALDSILSQQHGHEMELIVVDGGSTTGILEVLEKYRERISVLVSEPDGGIFDGMNKGIRLSSGSSDDVVHILAADDQYNDPLVVRDACYGDQVYLDELGRLVRYWKAGPYSRTRLYFGWMPPHPTFFVRRRVYEGRGPFDTRYQSPQTTSSCFG